MVAEDGGPLADQDAAWTVKLAEIEQLIAEGPEGPLARAASAAAAAAAAAASTPDPEPQPAAARPGDLGGDDPGPGLSRSAIEELVVQTLSGSEERHSRRAASAVAGVVAEAIAAAVAGANAAPGPLADARRELEATRAELAAAQAELRSCKAAMAVTAAPRGLDRAADDCAEVDAVQTLLTSAERNEYPFPPGLVPAVEAAARGEAQELLARFLSLGLHCRAQRQEKQTLLSVLEQVRAEATRRQQKQHETIDALAQRLRQVVGGGGGGGGGAGPRPVSPVGAGRAASPTGRSRATSPRRAPPPPPPAAPRATSPQPRAASPRRRPERRGAKAQRAVSAPRAWGAGPGRASPAGARSARPHGATAPLPASASPGVVEPMRVRRRPVHRAHKDDNPALRSMALRKFSRAPVG